MAVKMFVLLALLLALVQVTTAFNAYSSASSVRARGNIDMKKVLIVGGTRFSGLYLWKELHDRGHEVTLYNRGKSALQKLPRETDAAFEARKSAARFIKGDRQVAAEMQEKLGKEKFDVVYDMNGREAADTAPLADIFNGKVRVQRLQPHVVLRLTPTPNPCLRRWTTSST
jgi:NADPH:quinone reductase-like Zn-dependent oxidoreductase